MSRNIIKDNPLAVVLINILIFTLLYIALASAFVVSMITLVAIIGALIYLDKVTFLEDIFVAYAKNKKTALVSLLILLLIFPILMGGNRYIVHIAVIGCLYAMLALGLNFQMGSTDMVNFAPAAFFGMGAYTSAVWATKMGGNPWIGLILAIVMSVILGYLIGLPTLRTKGYYLSLVTMAIQIMFTLLLTNTDAVGGPNGIAGVVPLSLGGVSFGESVTVLGMKLPYQVNYLYLSIIILIICSYIAMRLHMSRVGLAWNAIAEDETAANCLGINLISNKLLAFCVGGGFAGAAGAIYAHYMSFIGPTDFDFSKSLIIICMVILGGMDNVPGIITGAFLLAIIDERLRDFSDYRMLIYGLVLMTVLVVRPAGLVPKRVRKYALMFSKGDPVPDRISGRTSD